MNVLSSPELTGIIEGAAVPNGSSCICPPAEVLVEIVKRVMANVADMV